MERVPVSTRLFALQQDLNLTAFGLFSDGMNTPTLAAEQKPLSAVDTTSFRAENARPASRRGTQAVNGGRL